MPLVPSAVETPCILCGGRDIEALSHRARDLRPLRTTICRQCGLVWANPPPVQDAVREYYSREYRQDYKGTPVRTIPQIYHAGLGALARYRSIAHLLRRDDRILDVGCGGGELVYLLRRLAFNAEGIEPDWQFSEAARQTLGLPVQTGFIQDFDFPAGAFRVILMYHVLEHVDRPVEVLSRLREWMSDGGRLVVEVPNIEAKREAPITRFHVAHLFYYCPETLAGMAARAGLAVEEVRLAPDGGTITAVFARSAGAAQPAGGPETYRRITRTLRQHTNMRYYLSATPYSRMLARVRTYLVKQLVARRMHDGKETLDLLFQDV